MIRKFALFLNKWWPTWILTFIAFLFIESTDLLFPCLLCDSVKCKATSLIICSYKMVTFSRMYIRIKDLIIGNMFRNKSIRVGAEWTLNKSQRERYSRRHFKNHQSEMTFLPIISYFIILPGPSTTEIFISRYVLVFVYKMPFKFNCVILCIQTFSMFDTVFNFQYI